MAATAPAPSTQQSATTLLIERALSRAGGTPLIEGNSIDVLIDAQQNFDAWLASIRAAKTCILFENYIFSDDDIGRQFREALRARAKDGIKVHVIYDWLGCLGSSKPSFWKPLIDAGGQVRVYNPPRLDSPLGWLARNHRKLIVVDGSIGYISGVCVDAKWLGNRKKNIAPWRDTGVALRGPACADMTQAFASNWASLGTPLDVDCLTTCPPIGDVALRVIATQPRSAGIFRTDQLIAAMARKSLWITDAYFIGLAPYVQALGAAAIDGVDVRLLVPGTSDLKFVARLSQAGYRPLLESGVRVFEWNGPMLHAKSAVADGLWARVGSSNMNISSWFANSEIDVAVENDAFAQCLAAQYETDLANATEIVLSNKRISRASSAPKTRRPRSGVGSSSRAAAGTLRLVNTVGAALGNKRVLGRSEAGVLLVSGSLLIALAFVGVIWPRTLAWPLALIIVWIGFNLVAAYVRTRRSQPPATQD
ncbi:MAG: phospholipase D-like domain-containing protein [Rudaea sp.]